MKKIPRFIFSSKTLNILHTKPHISFGWDAGRTAVLVYKLPNGKYLHYSVRKRTSEITELPF